MNTEWIVLFLERQSYLRYPGFLVTPKPGNEKQVIADAQTVTSDTMMGFIVWNVYI